MGKGDKQGNLEVSKTDPKQQGLKLGLNTQFPLGVSGGGQFQATVSCEIFNF